MNLARRFHDALSATALLAMLTFVVADGHTLLAPIVLVVSAAAWLLGRTSGAAPVLPRAAVSLLVLASILYAAFDAGVSRTEPIVSTLGVFLVQITCVKLFDRRTARDDAQVLTLSMFDVIAAVLTGNSLLVGILLLVLTPTGIFAAMLWQLCEHRDRGAVHARSSVAFSGIWGRRAPRHLWLTAIGASLACCIGAAVVFVFAPRGFASDLMGRFGQVREASIGFTETARLGASGLLQDNPTPVMDVSITDTEGTNLGSIESMLYLRGSVKEEYDPETATWISSPPSANMDSERVYAGESWKKRTTDPSLSRTAIIRSIKITHRTNPGESGVLFTMWRPVSMVFGQGDDIIFNPDTRVIRRTRNNFPGRDRGSGRYEYTVKVLVADEPGEPPAQTPPTFEKGKIRDLTEKVLTDAGVVLEANDGSLRQATVAIRDYLRTQYAYTLEMTAPNIGEDAIEMFLFRTRVGHCEYFASAMAAMCQSVGIPARLVLGYVTSDYSPITGQYLVRESNAHAWVEAHIGRGRWMTFDPSPPGDIDRVHRPSTSIIAGLRRWWDALEFSWAKSVVGFDSSSQNKLLGREPASMRRTSRSIETVADRVASWLRTQRSEATSGIRGVLAIAAPIFVLSAFVVIFIRSWGRIRAWFSRFRARRTNDPELNAALAHAPFFARAADALADAGLARPMHIPPIAHAESVSIIDSQLGAAAARVAELFYAVRFGASRLRPDELDEGRRLAEIMSARAKELKRRARGSKKRSRPAHPAAHAGK